MTNDGFCGTIMALQLMCAPNKMLMILVSLIRVMFIRDCLLGHSSTAETCANKYTTR
jgi:hypothetical protein